MLVCLLNQCLEVSACRSPAKQHSLGGTSEAGAVGILRRRTPPPGIIHTKLPCFISAARQYLGLLFQKMHCLLCSASGEPGRGALDFPRSSPDPSAPNRRLLSVPSSVREIALGGERGKPWDVLQKAQEGKARDWDSFMYI